MNNYQDNEIKYCTHCGSANKKSAVFCSECEKKLATIYRPFYDFLKKHTKDDVSGTVTDTFFSFLKNYLMSHIYGIALSVSIVATAVSAVYASEPYIEKIKDVNINTPAIEESQEETMSLTDDDLYDFDHLTSNYDAFVDALRSSESYWTGPDYYGSASEMYAENNIDGYSYNGAHEMISNPISMHMLDVDPNFETEASFVDFKSNRYTDTSSVTTGENCTSSIAKKLHSDGYRVAECNYVLVETADMSNDETVVESTYTKKLVYRFVFVEHNGNWYIAEDRLVQRVNV